MTNDAPNEDQAQTAKSGRLIPILLGAIAVTGVAASLLVGTGAVSVPREVKSDKVAGLDSIDAGLLKADAAGTVVPLTFDDGKIDILYAGAPDCSHCQAFMKSGFDDLLQYAKSHDLDLAYMPMALSGLGVAIGSVEDCALPAASVPADEVVRRAYGSVETIQARAREVSKAAKENPSETDVEKTLLDVMSGLHHTLSENTDFDAACYKDEIQTLGGRMSSFAETFGLTGTPTFYFMSGEGTVFRTVGEPDFDAMEKAFE